MAINTLSAASWPRHLLHLEVPGTVEVVVAHGSDETRDLAALIYGEVGQMPLVRVHSRCLYGEVFGSLDCDCRVQLLASLRLMATAGSGILVYLDQEGRGAGLYGKAQGYQYAQLQGVDSFAAYEALELEADSRRYADAAALLGGLGIRAIRLITNNPSKVTSMEGAGLTVERVPLDPGSVGYPVPEQAKAYVATKRRRGHLT